MIKAVAAALVLIAGAAVVLWFGNTLNSWVLGGLIGGLAALLLSIPISLTMFSYLSHRHDEQLRAEAELAEAEFSQMYEYEQIPARSARGNVLKLRSTLRLKKRNSGMRMRVLSATTPADA